jgi:hypothetical protein
MKPLIPYIIAHCGDLLIAILGLVSGILYSFRPNWVGNYRVERDREKFRWFGIIFTTAGIGLLICLTVGYLNSN